MSAERLIHDAMDRLCVPDGSTSTRLQWLAEALGPMGVLGAAIDRGPVPAGEQLDAARGIVYRWMDHGVEEAYRRALFHAVADGRVTPERAAEASRHRGTLVSLIFDTPEPFRVPEPETP